MTFDIVALCRDNPSPGTVIAAMLAAGPDLRVDTVSHALTRWSNIRGLEVHVGFVRADLPRYGILVNIREPGFQARAEIADDAGSALGDFGAVCVERAEHATRRAE